MRLAIKKDKENNYEDLFPMRYTADLYNYLGIAFFSQERYEDAKMYFLKAIDNDPKRSIYYKNYADSLIKQGKNPEAL